MDNNIITFFIILSSLFISFFFFFFKKPKYVNLPPGPPKLPIIGNLHQIAGSLPHRAFLDLSKKYGPVMHLQLGGLSTVIVSSPRLAKDVFKTNDIALAYRPYALVADIVLHGTSDVVFGPYGDYWRQLKKIMTVELLSAKKVRSFGGLRRQEMDRFSDFIRSNLGKPVTIHQKLMEMTNTLVCKAIFGDKCKQQDVLLDLVDDLGRLVSGFYVADLWPDSWVLPIISGMKSKVTKIHKTLDKIFNDIFDERRKSRSQRDGQSDHDILDVLFNIKESGGLQFPITDQNIKAVFVNMFTGGTDTSAATMEWAMSELMKNPSVMEKAQKEVREKFHGKETITETDIQDLVYLKFIIKETLRLHPPLPLLVPRECREQCKIDGYDIPVKTKVLYSFFACGRDPEYWDDAECFKPERFEQSLADLLGTHYELLPFGSGRRICPGITFALTSVEFSLAHMLYYFNWQLPSGVGPKDVDMTECDGAIAGKKVPLLVIPTLYSSI